MAVYSRKYLVGITYNLNVPILIVNEICRINRRSIQELEESWNI
jgi:hypothetical protein